MSSGFDELLVAINPFGRYQKLVIAVFTIVYFFMWRNDSTLFVAPKVKFRCAVPPAVFAEMSLNLTDDTFQPRSEIVSEVLNKTVPYVYDNRTCDFRYSMCDMYLNSSNNTETIPCDTWVFDKSMYELTVIEQFSLVCGRKVYRTIILMAAPLGMLLGSLICGLLSDRYGRRKVFVICQVVDFISALITAWSPNYIVFFVFKVISGAATIGASMTLMILCIELCGPTKRLWVGFLNNIVGVFSYGTLALVGYALTDWHYICLTVALVMLLPMPLLWMMPESPRWLLTRGRYDEAMIIIEKIARYNKTTIPGNFRDAKALMNIDDPVSSNEIEIKNLSPSTDKLWHMLSTPRLAFQSCIIVFSWIAVTLGFYGIYFNIATFTTNPFLNYFLGAIVESPSFFIYILLLDRIGRKPLYAGGMVFGGVACICSIFPVVFAANDSCSSDDLNVGSLALSLVGRLGIFLGFMVLYIFTPELLPTTIRNGGMGFSSTCARLGGIASPFLAQVNVTGRFGPAFPLLIFGGVAVTSGVLSLLLPETRNRVLPETIVDANSFAKSRRARITVQALGEDEEKVY